MFDYETTRVVWRNIMLVIINIIIREQLTCLTDL